MDTNLWAMRPCQAFESKVTCLAFLEGDPDTVYVVGDDNVFTAWDVQPNVPPTKRHEFKLELQSKITRLLLINPFGTIVGTEDGELALFHIGEKILLKGVAGHRDAVVDLYHYVPERRIMSVGQDRKIIVWSETLDEVCSIQSSLEIVASNPFVTRSAKSFDFVMVQRRGAALFQKLDKLGDIDASCGSTKLPTHSFAPVLCCSLAPDGSLLVCGNIEGKAVVSDASTGTCFRQYDFQGRVLQVGFSPNRYWVFGRTRQGLRIYDLETHEKQLDFRLPDTDVHRLVDFSFSPNGNIGVIGFSDGSVTVIDVQS